MPAYFIAFHFISHICTHTIKHTPTHRHTPSHIHLHTHTVTSVHSILMHISHLSSLISFSFARVKNYNKISQKCRIVQDWKSFWFWWFQRFKVLTISFNCCLHFNSCCLPLLLLWLLLLLRLQWQWLTEGTLLDSVFAVWQQFQCWFIWHVEILYFNV